MYKHRNKQPVLSDWAQRTVQGNLDLPEEEPTLVRDRRARRKVDLPPHCEPAVPRHRQSITPAPLEGCDLRGGQPPLRGGQNVRPLRERGAERGIVAGDEHAMVGLDEHLEEGEDGEGDALKEALSRKVALEVRHVVRHVRRRVCQYLPGPAAAPSAFLLRKERT